MPKIGPAASVSLPPLTSIHYQFTTVSVPGAQFYNLFMNDNGVASGSVIDEANRVHCFLWHASEGSVLDVPGAQNSGFNGLNNRGMVSGIADGVSWLFDTHNQRWTRLELPAVPGLPLSLAIAVNNRGLLLGFSSDENGLNEIGWTWDGNSYSFFSVPEASGAAGGTAPQGFNDNGETVGVYVDAQDTVHGFHMEGSNISTIDVPGADATFPVGINNQGDIAGYYYLNGPPFVAYGFVLHRGTFVTVQVPGSTACGMSAINDRGQLSGIFFDSSGNSNGFIATP
jgi:hypothetical protein